jgi:putative ABC transport system permease protein
MQLKQLIRIATKSLIVNRSRSFLTALGVIIGVAAVILLVSVGSGLKDYITGQMQDMGSNLIMVVPGDIDIEQTGASGGAASGAFSSIAASKLELRDAEEIERSLPQIKDTAAVVMAPGLASYKSETVSGQIIGTTQNYINIRSSEFETGSFFTQSEVNSGRKVTILGHTVAHELFGNQNPVGEKIKVGDYRYLVMGVMKEQGGQGSLTSDDKIFVPITTAQRQFGLDNISIIFTQVSSSDEVASAVPLIEAVMLKRHDEEDFTVIDQKEILSTVSSILDTLTIALGGIAAISLLVGGIGIMNIMLVSVTERTREIGLRKALGATPEVILTQFLIEAVFLSVGGGIIGILLGSGGALLLNNFIPMTVTAWSIILAFVVSAGVGIIFGIAPARRASLLSPIAALRYE